MSDINVKHIQEDTPVSDDSIKIRSEYHTTKDGTHEWTFKVDKQEGSSITVRINPFEVSLCDNFFELLDTIPTVTRKVIELTLGMAEDV